MNTDKTGWTPGPYYRQGKTVYALGADGFNIMSALVQDPRTGTDELEATAQLFAAAPSLYEALKAALDCGLIPKSSAVDGGANKYSEQVRVADMCRSALAKARGEKS